MDKKQLRQLSKNQLIELLFAERDARIKLEQRLEELERSLKAFDNAHTPSSKRMKRNTEDNEDKPRFPGKPKGGNGGGIELPPPDEIEEHKLDSCPDCSTSLGKPVGMSKKTVMDLPEKLAITTEHHIYQYCCSQCKKEISANIILPSGIYGPRIQSFITLLKDNTLSHDRVSTFIKELGFPTLSGSSTLNIIQQLVAKLKPLRALFLDTMKKVSFIHCDETGLRMDGRNGYVWGIFTNSIAILSAELTRGRKHIERLLEGFTGVIVTDGYVAYDCFPLRQRCWAHLIREFKELAEKNKEIELQYGRIKLLYEHLKELNKEPPNEIKIEKAKCQLKDIVTCLNTIKEGRKLANHIENAGDDWFTALYHEGVPLENNAAERGLRHIVLHRKMMGCYRNQKGKDWIDIGMSVLQSWRLQGKNTYQELCAIAQLT